MARTQADDHSGSYLALGQSLLFPSYMASVVQSAGGSERQSTTWWLAGSAGSMWTSANPSTIEPVQARTRCRGNFQKPRRHASLAVRSHSSPRELHDASHGTRDEHQPERYAIDAHGPDDSTRLIAACLVLVSIVNGMLAEPDGPLRSN